ncbi:MAG: transcriptional regulator, TetR family [Geminicoccaceae bacterium]|jgi:AcrR family transcriptional regulator|nr:transcriptional regulator, TetR family [Geminicoccaceae bacterium]
MGTRERRDRERQETRTKILDAAREMFVAEGLEAATMREIAKRIEYTPTAIYHHFRDKRALITELVEQDFLAFANALQKTARIEDPVERLRASGLAYVDFGLTHPNHYRVLFMTPALAEEKSEVHSAHKGHPGEDAYGFLCETVAACIDAGRFRKELKDPELVAQMMWAGVHGLVSLHNVNVAGKAIAWRDPRKTARVLVDNAIRGALREED